jgi:hypothetical protein
MLRIALSLLIQPYEIEATVNIKSSGAFIYRVVGIIDTGAQRCLFPLSLLDVIDHEAIEEVTLEQAGIAKQAFSAKEATIFLKLEDRYGNISPELSVRAWFAETDRILIGFQDILDRAALHADFLQSLTGYIELQDKP